MAKKEIDGITISINGEHLDKDGYTRCNKCNGKTILVSAESGWRPDSEPFKDGEEIELEDADEIFVGEVSGHFCQQCDMLTSLSYNFP
ncbi:MAG: hypothetical protein MUP81_01775 [Dehalococcoidia bacterium]|nr:hypothetical protein [Dehalococcoidia bacterium]